MLALRPCAVICKHDLPKNKNKKKKKKKKTGQHARILAGQDGHGARRNLFMLQLRLPIVPATPRVIYVRSRVIRCAGSAGRRCRRCAREQHERVGWQAKQALQRRQGTTLQGRMAMAQETDNAPNKPKTQRTETLQPSSGDPRPLQAWRPPPAGRSNCDARPIQCPRWDGAQDARWSSAASAWWWTPRSSTPGGGLSGP